MVRPRISARWRVNSPRRPTWMEVTVCSEAALGRTVEVGSEWIVGKQRYGLMDKNWI